MEWTYPIYIAISMNCVEAAVHLTLAAPRAHSWIDNCGFHAHKRFGADQFRLKEESQVRRVHIAIRKYKGTG